MIEKGVNLAYSPLLFFIPTEDGYDRTQLAQDAWSHSLHLDWGETILRRFEYAKSFDQYAELLPEWSFSDGNSYRSAIWDMFHYEELPPVGSQAIKITEYALDQYVSMAEQHNFHLLLVSGGLTKFWSHNNADGRQRLERGAVERVERFAEERNLPFLDLYPELVPQGKLSEIRFRYDGHWNEEGHRRAAKGMFEFLVKNPELLR